MPWPAFGPGALEGDGGPDPYGGPDDYDAAGDYDYEPAGDDDYVVPGVFDYDAPGGFDDDAAGDSAFVDDGAAGPAGDYWAGLAGTPWAAGPASGPPGQFGAAGRAEPGQAAPPAAAAATPYVSIPRAAPAATPDASPEPGTAPAPGARAAGVPSLPARARRPVAQDSAVPGLPGPGRHKAPSGGWRRAVAGVTGGLVRAPEPAAERRRRDLTTRARSPLSRGHQRVAVISLKGGVGKTTTAMGLGSTLASVRPDRVIAVDASPDRGTLADRLRLETAATVRDLLHERQQIAGYPDIRAYTTQAPSRLEVLGSDRDPASPAAFGEADYRDVAALLEPYYAICLADCGTGLRHSAMTGVLRLADQIVLVSSPSVDGARSASAALDWLLAQGHGILARRAVVVLDVIRPQGKSAVDLGRLEQQFAARCRAVVTVPYDPHLEEGAEVHLGRLNQATADAFLALAAEVGDGFAGEPRPPR